MEENLHCLRKGTRLIGRYIIEGVLGQGGFGITYLGIDELHEKKVAIKEFFPQGIVTRNIEYQDTVTVTFVGEKDNYEKGKERFLKEARTMVKFSKDEGIVKALDFFEINNTAYIVMEYLEGITLKQYLRENQRIAPEPNSFKNKEGNSPNINIYYITTNNPTKKGETHEKNKTTHRNPNPVNCRNMLYELRQSSSRNRTGSLHIFHEESL